MNGLNEKGGYFMFDNNEIYLSDISWVASIDLPWGKLKNKSILITGVTGLICSFLADVLMYRNRNFKDGITIYALSRSKQSLEKRFSSYLGDASLIFIEHDVSEPLKIDFQADYIIHGASNADPISFSLDPVGTMKANIFGIYNLLEYARFHNTKRVLYISSGEVYGEGSQEINSFTEDYSGYVNCTDPRSCYPSSKRAAESMCGSYIKQYGLDVVIARPCHIYGPTMKESDSRASAQFIRNAISKKDIVMKSKGLQIRSYCYVADAVSALLYILFKGETGHAYNIANKNSNVTIKKFAETVASLFGLQIKFEVPDSIEKDGYSKITKAVLDASKLEGLGWRPMFSLKDGIYRTVTILRKEFKIDD